MSVGPYSKNALVSLALFCCTPALALQLEEQVVSATYRNTQLQNTALAISAFSREQVLALVVENAQDLALHTPSLTIGQAVHSASIRGIGHSNDSFGSDPGVAIYSDGVYIADSSILNHTNLFDTARVEVVRGPQGTLYGRNAAGGAINTISISPGVTWKTRVNAELGNNDYQALQGLMTGPITDQFSMAIAASSIERSESHGNTLGSDYLRLSFKYHWTHNWYSRIQFAGVNAEEWPDQETETRASYLLNEIALGDYRIKHIAAWNEYEFERGGANNPSFANSDQTLRESSTTSQDLQFYSALSGEFNFVSGLYYRRSDEDQHQTIRANSDGPSVYRAETGMVTSSWAGYGQGEWDFADDYRLTLGLRYSLDDKEADDITWAQWFDDDETRRETDQTWDRLDWRLGLDYRSDEGELLYTSLATGYRSGGFNLGQSSATPSVEELAPEDVLAIELGYKGALFERLQLATAVYYYDYQDMRLTYRSQADGLNLYSRGIAGEGDGWGAEIEFSLPLTEKIATGGSYSYNHTRYQKTAASELEGDNFPLSPEHELSLYVVADWTWSWARMNSSLSYLFVDEQYVTPLGIENPHLVKRYDRWDAQLGAHYGLWSVTGFAKNITDENYRDDSLWGVPRTYGIKVSYRL
ncbi:hypothetical protein EY643_05855 [Halioglobus maricola]|uniref:YTH domain-containing protein n=1 Tax=Halioglobus maricola TaxID=2601894 RepID=A0A5P9NHB4_9GAMM|nr:TonB-dependent receptor [Halioglobus maricola]QFU75213.1 hypothetical protein EY643_05855 [Halioglobus maricola]